MNDDSRDKPVWQSSARCADGACAEVMYDGADLVLLRSNLRPDTVLRLTAGEWSAFLAGVKGGDFG